MDRTAINNWRFSGFIKEPDHDEDLEDFRSSASALTGLSDIYKIQDRPGEMAPTTLFDAFDSVSKVSYQ